MKQFISYLQHPIVKIFISPLASIIFGLILGFQVTKTPNFLIAAALYGLVIFTQLIEHFQYHRYIAANQKQTPMSIYYVCLAICIILALVFILTQHWAISILIILYLLFIFLQYYPFYLVGTFNYIFLSTFFNGFILNIVAYYSQSHQLSNKFLLDLIPIVIYCMASNLITNDLKSTLPTLPKFQILNQNIKKIAFAMMLIALLLGIYFSLPTHSYLLGQIFMLTFVPLVSIPNLISVKTMDKIQNKINFNASMMLCFNLLYLIAYIF